MGTVAKLNREAQDAIAALERDVRAWLVAYTPGDAAGPPPRYATRVRTVALSGRDLERVRELERRLGVWLVAYDASLGD